MKKRIAPTALQQPVAPVQVPQVTQPQETPAPASVPPIPPAPSAGAGKPTPPTQQDLYTAMFESLDPSGTDEKHKRRDEVFKQYLSSTVEAHAVSKTYNVLLIHDESTMIRGDADRVYAAASSFADKKPLLLVLYSTGGSIGSAYLIGKLCREYAKEKFVVVVPRQAKSAATLICCAADEIHMGSLSELGPIDPQIDELPALGLKHSVEHLADLVKQNPAASEMFARYLHYSLKPVHLGYYERVAQSAAQYAERLLSLHPGTLPKPAGKIASDLVYTYKDHGFVIDRAEAEIIFGPQVVKTRTPEYDFGNAVYRVLSSVAEFAGWVNHGFYMIGNTDSKPMFWKRRT
jgi:hypothetical protein